MELTSHNFAEQRCMAFFLKSFHSSGPITSLVPKKNYSESTVNSGLAKARKKVLLVNDLQEIVFSVMKNECPLKLKIIDNVVEFSLLIKP